MRRVWLLQSDALIPYLGEAKLEVETNQNSEFLSFIRVAH